MAKKVQDALKDIISLCKRRGFIFPGSEIYDGLANTWDYGPYGVELKRNIKNLWWKKFVTSRQDVLGLDSSILLNPRVWKASGHVGRLPRLPRTFPCRPTFGRQARRRLLRRQEL